MHLRGLARRLGLTQCRALDLFNDFPKLDVAIVRIRDDLPIPEAHQHMAIGDVSALLIGRTTSQ
jgi:hypothetical protein